MIDAFFTAFGTIFATGVGILLLAALTGAIFVLWDWRIALVGAVLVHLGSCSILVLVHGVSGLMIAGQVLAVTLAATILIVAGLLHPNSKSLHQAGYWPLRLMALVFIIFAWWYLDPGYTLPSFSQPETDPLMGAAAVLLLSMPMYALASVLLPGSGLPVIVGIADILLALACSYLVLLEPASSRGVTRRLAPSSVATAMTPQQRPPREALPPVPATGSPIASEPIQEKAV
jgi:hypothetical protein